MSLELPPDMENFEIVEEFEDISGLLLPKLSGLYKFVVLDVGELDLAVGKRTFDYRHIVEDYLRRRNISDYVEMGRGVLELNHNFNSIVFGKYNGFYCPNRETIRELMLGVNLRWECNF